MYGAKHSLYDSLPHYCAWLGMCFFNGLFHCIFQQISEHLIPSLNSGDAEYQNASISLVSNDGCKVLQNNKNYSSPFLDRTRYSSSPAAECTVTSIAPYHREVITVRTPLPHNDQESCV